MPLDVQSSSELDFLVRLKKLWAMLFSNEDNEALNARNAIQRFLSQSGVHPNDITLLPEQSHRVASLLTSLLERCEKHQSEREMMVSKCEQLAAELAEAQQQITMLISGGLAPSNSPKKSRSPVKRVVATHFSGGFSWRVKTNSTRPDGSFIWLPNGSRLMFKIRRPKVLVFHAEVFDDRIIFEGEVMTSAHDFLAHARGRLPGPKARIGDPLNDIWVWLPSHTEAIKAQSLIRSPTGELLVPLKQSCG